MFSVYVDNLLWVLSEELVTAFWTGSCGPVFGIHTTYYSISWLFHFPVSVLKSLWTSNWILFHHVDIPKFAIASSNIPFRTNRIFRSFEVAVVTRTITHGYLRSFLWMLHVCQKYCSHHQKQFHMKEECFALHPELLEAFRTKRARKTEDQHQNHT